jgi:hypothetical protein
MFDEIHKRLLDLPNLNLLYAKLGMRKRRLERIEALIEDTDRTKLLQWEMAQYVRTNELGLVSECQKEIDEVHKKIDEISICFGQEMSKEMLPVVGEVLYELGLTETKQ